MLDMNNVRTREALWVAGGILFMFAVLGALMLALSSCHHVPEPLPPMPDTPEAACANLSRLECPEAKPSRTGALCPDVVRKMLRLRPLDLKCVANAPAVSDLRDCGGVRCEW
jgi:hypothetical protein